MMKSPHGKSVLTMFVLTNIVYVFMLSVTIPGVLKFTGGMEIFDMMPGGYSYTYAAELLEVLGAEGRNYYLYRQIPADMLYPGLFAVSYSMVIVYFLNKLGRNSGLQRMLVYFPVVSGLFDYLENVCIILMIKGFPELSHNIVSAGNIFSVTKSVSTTITFVILLYFTVYYIVKFKIYSKPKTTNI